MQAIVIVDVTSSSHLDLQALGEIQPNQTFYISLEPKGGSSSNRPSGSILFQGPAVNLNTE